MAAATPSARSSTSHKSATISRGAQETSVAPGPQRNTAEVKILRPIELNEILMIARLQRLRLSM